MEKRATLIIDSPPLLPVTDAAVLSQLAGGAIIVIATGKTRREQLRTAESSIEGVNGKILGLVMNMAPVKGPDSHRYGYGYSYDYKTITTRGKLEEHPTVVPAGLGGLPGVNGSPTPTTPVGPVPVKGRATASTAAVAPATPPTQPVKTEDSVPSPANPSTAPKGSEKATPSDLVNRALGRDAPLKQTVATDDKVIGHSLKVPLPEPVVDDPPMRFEADADPVGDWTPPRPRPAFDPLTAPLDEIAPE